MRRKEMKGSKKKNGRWRWLLQGHDAAAKSLQSCPTLCDPRDGSPPGSLVPGILQARTLEGLPFPSPVHESEKWKWGHSVLSDSSQPHGLPPTRLLRPWDFPGNSTGVGCHCLLRLQGHRQWQSEDWLFPGHLLLKISLTNLMWGFRSNQDWEFSVWFYVPSNLFYFYFFALHTWAATAGEKSELGALLPARTQEKW